MGKNFDKICIMGYGQAMTFQIPALIAAVLGLAGEVSSRKPRGILSARFVLTLASLVWLATLAGIGVYQIINLPAKDNRRDLLPLLSSSPELI